ncbi:DUF1214 domain-containing protein [Streptomyces sp. KL116D]
MAAKTVGTGSQYAYTAEDSTGAWLDGGRTYRPRLPAGVPAKNFWAMDLYDTQHPGRSCRPTTPTRR